MTLSDEKYDELDHGSHNERSNGPGHDGNDALKSLYEDDTWSEDHDEFVGDATKSPALALRQEDIPVLGDDGVCLGTQSLCGELVGVQTKDDGRVDAVFRVVAHDVLSHHVVGLGAVSESIAEDSIAESGLVDADELTAARETVDLAGDARLEHASQALGLGIFDRLVERPWREPFAVEIDTDVAADADDVGIGANLAEHLADAVLVKDGVCVHTSEEVNRVDAELNKAVADVFVEIIVEHGDDILRAHLEVVEKRASKAQTITFALIVAFSDKDIWDTLVVASLDPDRHEETIAGTVTIFESFGLARSEDILDEVVLSSLGHAGAAGVTVNNDEDGSRMAIKTLLRNERIQRANQFRVGFVVAGQEEDHFLKFCGDNLLLAKPPRHDASANPVEEDANHHEQLEHGV